MIRNAGRTAAGTAASLLIGAAMLLHPAAASAQNTVKIGVIYPLSGNAAGAGNAAKAGVEIAAEIVNGAHPELGHLPLAATQGLPRLKGAKVEPIFSDHQGNPSVGQSQTVRLITEEKVVAMFGVYHSSVAMSATAEAEREGIPFVIGDSVAKDITGRGFANVFRTTPIAPDLAHTYMLFLKDLAKMRPVKTIAVVNENTDYVTSVANNIADAAKDSPFEVVARIPYSAGGTDVSPQVLQLKEKNPDVVIFASYTNDAILYMKTLRNLDYRPPIFLADDAGFSDPAFVKSVGELSQGIFNRSAYKVGKPGSVSYKINQMYRAKTGADIDDATGRSIMGFIVLCDAINRAGSTEPEAIRKALRETNFTQDQVMLGYRGVKFDATGQNTEGSNYIIQLIGDQYVAVWPFNQADAKLDHYFIGWK